MVSVSSAYIEHITCKVFNSMLSPNLAFFVILHVTIFIDMKTFSQSSPKDDWDEWFKKERGTAIDYDEESDVDEVEEDSYNDPESL